MRGAAGRGRVVAAILAFGAASAVCATAIGASPSAGAGGYTVAYSRSISNPLGIAELYPAGAVAAPDGSWYVADSGGNRVDRIDPVTGDITTAALAGLDRPRDIAIDPVSNSLWVVDTGDNEIIEVTTAGALLHTFTGYKSPFGIAVDAGGVYVADTYNNRIRKIEKTTGAEMWAATACGTALARPRDVTVGTDGRVYAVDTDHNRVVAFAPADGSCLGAFGTAGTALGQLKGPRSIAADAGGGLWVAEAANARLQHFTFAGASLGISTVKRGDGPAQLNQPSCVFVAGSVVGGCDVYRILRFTVNGTGAPVYGSTILGDPPVGGGFNEPFGVAYDGTNRLAVTDMFNHRVQLLDANEQFVREWGKFGSGVSHFIFPRGVTWDAAGNIVVTNSENNRIDVFTDAAVLVKSVKPKTLPTLQWSYQTVAMPDGSFWIADTNRNRILHMAGDGTVLFSFDNGGTIKTPRGLAMDAAGNLYVSNTPKNRVEKYDQSGNLIATLATAGAGAAQVKGPWNLTVSAASGQELLYIADSFNNRVVVMTTSGVAVTKFGSYGTGAGQFRAPWSVAVSSVDGRVAVADSSNNRVSIFLPV